MNHSKRVLCNMPVSIFFEINFADWIIDLVLLISFFFLRQFFLFIFLFAQLLKPDPREIYILDNKEASL